MSRRQWGVAQSTETSDDGRRAQQSRQSPERETTAAVCLQTASHAQSTVRDPGVPADRSSDIDHIKCRLSDVPQIDRWGHNAQWFSVFALSVSRFSPHTNYTGNPGILIIFVSLSRVCYIASPVPARRGRARLTVPQNSASSAQRGTARFAPAPRPRPPHSCTHTHTLGPQQLDTLSDTATSAEVAAAWSVVSSESICVSALFLLSSILPFFVVLLSVAAFFCRSAAPGPCWRRRNSQGMRHRRSRVRMRPQRISVSLMAARIATRTRKLSHPSIKKPDDSEPMPKFTERDTATVMM